MAFPPLLCRAGTKAARKLTATRKFIFRGNRAPVSNRRGKQVAAERRRKWPSFIAKGKSVCSKRTSHNLAFIIHKTVVTLTDARSSHLCLLSLLVLRILQIKYSHMGEAARSSSEIIICEFHPCLSVWTVYVNLCLKLINMRVNVHINIRRCTLAFSTSTLLCRQYFVSYIR